MSNPDKNLKCNECRNVNSIFLGTMVHDFSSNSKTFPKGSIEEVHMKSQSLTTNVHVNPKFKPQVPAIHINPKIQAKPLIHINPKMMHNIAGSNQNIQNNVTVTTKADTNSSTTQINIKRSIYVNPTLLKNLSSSSKDEPTSLKEPITRGRPNCLGLTPVKNMNNRKVIPKKFSDSRVVLLSRRKLVRIARTVNSTSETSSISQNKLQRPADLIQKKSDNLLQRTMKAPSLVNNALQSTSIRGNEIRLPKSGIDKSKVTKYKIDRTILDIPKIKRRNLLVQRTRKVISDNVELVTIGGIVYKSSKNRLIRRSCSLKRKRSINGNSNKLIATNNGTKLKSSKGTLNHMVETHISSKTRFAPNISSKVTYKNNISNKVKQRSIQILRNKMHKNNQPCLIFQRFGYCLNHKNGSCPKRHDKKQVSICKKFLQGKCLLDKCPLSHDVGPEKMPTCKYFLDGCCTRDACPYLHVKVSSNTSICIDFLQGYCAKGNECQRRHEYLCPDFDKLGNCSKGKYCPYPHKSHSSSTEENTKYLSKITHGVQEHQATSDAKHDPEISNVESRLRYYEQTDNSSDDFEKKKENILKKIKIMKRTLNNGLIVDPISQAQVKEASKSLVKEDENESITESNIKRRVPIGSLPAYIPIN